MFPITVKKYLFAASCTVLLLLSLYTLFRSAKIHLQSINFPYQLEYREGAVLPITDLYVNNENPYDFKFQPQDTYNYGFLYPLTVSPFAKAFGNTLAVHRWVTYACILITCLLIFFTLLRMKVNLVFSVSAAVILHQSLIYHGLASIARPEGLGIFLYVLGILIPWRFKFSRLSCLASIFIGILGYFTKPYYVLVIPYMLIYLFFFVSRRKALMYGIVSFFLISITAITVNLVYESFYNNTVFIHLNYATYELDHLKKQLLSYLRVNIFLILIIFLSCIIIIKNFIFAPNEFKKVCKKYNIKFLFNKGVKIFGDEPVLKTNLDLLFSFVLFLSMLLFILKLGGNPGIEDAAYLFHLVSPFLILTTFQIINANKNKIYQTLVAAMLIAALLLQFKPVRFKLNWYTDEIKKTEDMIAKSKNVLNSGENVSIMLKQNKLVYNSGHTEYFHLGISELANFLGVSKGVEKRHNEFRTDLNEKISKKEFDLILISKTLKNYDYFFIDRDNLIQNYQFTDTLKGYLNNIEAWYPIK